MRFWRLEVQIFLGTFWTFGEMSERLKERDWKSRICNSIVGSNPTLSERLISFYISYSGRLRQFLMNPPGSEGSNGKSIELGASLLVIRGFYFKKLIKRLFKILEIILTKLMYLYTMIDINFME